MRCDNCAAIIMPSEQKTHVCRSPGMDVAMETESAVSQPAIYIYICVTLSFVTDANTD